jgi:hypothetical protein
MAVGDDVRYPVQKGCSACGVAARRDAMDCVTTSVRNTRGSRYARAFYLHALVSVLLGRGSRVPALW